MLELFRTGVIGLLEQYVPEIKEPEVVSEVFVAQIFAAFIQHIFDPSQNTDLIADRAAQTLVRSVL
jgi:hypothetical protein